MRKRPGNPSAREIRVLQAVVECGSVAKAAEKLEISTSTVDAHIDHIREKSKCRTMAQIAVWAIQNGWLAETILF